MTFLWRHKRIASAWALVCLGVVLSLVLPHSFLLTAAGDLIQCLLLSWIMFNLVTNLARSGGRARVFWILLAFGCGMWWFFQLLWTYFEVVRRQEVPNPFIGDVALFLHLVPLMGALAARPDSDHTHVHRPDGTDFVLLLTWWTYLYLFIVIPWQYVSPDERLYGTSFDVLYFAEHFALLVATAIVWRASSGRWRVVYAGLFAAGSLYAVSSVAASIAIDFDAYYTGSAFDIPLLVAMGMFLQVTWLSRDTISSVETKKEGEQQLTWIPALANAAAFSLPLFAAWTVHFSKAPQAVRNFQLSLTLAAIVVIGALRSVKQYQLQGCLTRANTELQEASLTDLLTGIRNRRFFAHTIESDVRQVARWYSAADPRKRNSDLIFYLIDIDHFKEVNDLFGHDEGDNLLVQIAFRIAAAIRHSDVLIRWGGEEFLVLSRFSDRDEATILCARVLNAIGSEPFELKSGAAIRRTCSVGWAAFPWFAGNPTALHYEDVLRVADQALYRAKNCGRNIAIGILPESESLEETGPVVEICGLRSRVTVTPGPVVELEEQPAPAATNRDSNADPLHGSALL